MKNYLRNDTRLYRIVVSVLALTMLASIVGAIVLAAREYSTLGVILVVLGFAAIGVPAGLLAPSPLTR